MCGIAGLYDPRGHADLGRLHAMSRLLRHRGPDDEGIALIDVRGRAARVLGGADTPADVYAAGLPWTPGRGSADESAPPSGFGLGLVHRRLAIVDLTPSGHGPMSDASRRDCDTMIFDGSLSKQMMPT